MVNGPGGRSSSGAISPGAVAVVLEKLPPHDIAAEEAVVAACLVDGESIFKVAPILQPDDFFRERNGWVFDAIRTLWDRNEAINQITVSTTIWIAITFTAVLVVSPASTPQWVNMVR